LPLLPRRVGVVTSPTGAAIRDIIHVITRRTRTVNVLVAPTRVQGVGAGAEIARAIRSLNEHHLKAQREGRTRDLIDAIIVGRGGGSSEDLWSFNEEEVARAIRASRIPVISAVGHETDFTIADFAADVRAATPSAAAELVAAREDEMTAVVLTLSRDLVRAVEYRLLIERERVREAVSSEGFDEVRERLREARRATDDLTRRLETAMGRVRERARQKFERVARELSPARAATRASEGRVRLAVTRAALDANFGARLDDARARLEVAVASLDALSPLGVLGRGYALAQDARGRVVRVAGRVRAGEELRVRLAEGALRCRVEGVEGEN
jgi:exodeoxyribonuclease VII large subunit